MSSHRKPYGLNGGSRLVPQGVISDFPIPSCTECKAPMVKLEGQWGCKNCTQIQVLRPIVTEVEDGRPVTKVLPTMESLGEAYPNRAARRRMGRR